MSKPQSLVESRVPITVFCGLAMTQDRSGKDRVSANTGLASDAGHRFQPLLGDRHIDREQFSSALSSILAERHEVVMQGAALDNDNIGLSKGSCSRFLGLTL